MSVEEQTVTNLKDLNTKVIVKRPDSVEPTNSSTENLPLHDKMGKLTAEGFKVLIASTNSPAEHFTVDIGINAFKRYVRSIPGITKAMINDQVRRYKSKAWGEYTELVKHKGSFPTHNAVYCGA